MHRYPTELKALIAAIDEWEAADDQANEAAAALSSPAPLTRVEREELRVLQETAAQKLEALRKLVATDFEPSGF